MHGIAKPWSVAGPTTKNQTDAEVTTTPTIAANRDSVKILMRMTSLKMTTTGCCAGLKTTPDLNDDAQGVVAFLLHMCLHVAPKRHEIPDSKHELVLLVPVSGIEVLKLLESTRDHIQATSDTAKRWGKQRVI